MKKSIMLGLLLAALLSTPITVHAVEEQAEYTTTTVLDSGVWNNINWIMYSDGYLFLEAQANNDEYVSEPAWLVDYAETITSAKIVGDTITSTNGWFKGCTNLTSLDSSDWDTSNLRNADWMFYQCTNLETLDVSNWDMSSLQSGIQMFADCSSLTSLNVGNWGCTDQLVDISQMFENCTALESVNPGSWDITGLSDIDMLFSGCESLKTLDLSGWDTKNLSSISGTFQGCKSLETVELSDWNTTEVRDIGSLFNGCHSLKSADVSGWNLPYVTDIRYLFYECKSLTEVDLSNWTLGKVDRAFCMFFGCEKLESIKVGNWDLSLSTQLSNMFRDCKKVKALDLSGWTMGDLVQLDYMFSNCESLETLKLPDWNTGHVGNAEYMFYNCPNLVLELDFDGVNIEHLTSMFQGSSKITGNVTLGRFEAVYDAENCFTDAATAENTALYVTYRGLMRREQLEQIVATKSDNSHVYIKEVAPSSFAIDEEPEISIEVGEAYTIDLSMAPADANGTVWCSDVDSVSADGTDSGVISYKVDAYNRKVSIVGLKEGIVSLDICVEYDNDVIYLQDNCVIEVGNPAETCTRLRKITLVPEEVTLKKIGESRQLNVELFPKYAEMPELEWTEYNGVVSLSDTGLITAVKNGTGYVYATTADGKIVTSCTVYVEDPAAVEIKVTGMSLDKENLLLSEIGESCKLNPIFTPENATDKRVEWLSMDYGIATVDANGVVTAVAEGTTQIYAWALDGMYQASCNVRVNQNGAQVQEFVERMYTVALGREAEESGVAYWTERLLSGSTDGEDVACGFFDGAEFQSKVLTDEEYITILYNTFFGRTPVEAEISYYVDLFAKGITRRDVLNSFIASAEFDALCKEYGITAIFTAGSFVERMYTVALDRAAVPEEVDYWTELLLTKQKDGEDVAKGFFHSQEFTDRNLLIDAYIEVLYGTFFNREPGQEEIQYYAGLVLRGATRDDLLNNFINSPEFADLCEDYGIIAIFTKEMLVSNFVERLYTVALGRGAAESEISYYANLLLSGQAAGANVADNFISSAEFENRGLSDREYIETLYATFFNRTAPEEDITYWLNTIADSDRRTVLKGFANSGEFGTLCESYGIVRGEL